MGGGNFSSRTPTSNGARLDPKTKVFFPFMQVGVVNIAILKAILLSSRYSRTIMVFILIQAIIECACFVVETRK